MKWNQEFTEASQYALAAKGLYQNKKIDNQTLYHIVSLSVEQYAAAMASYLGFIPVHSGLSSVFREINGKVELPIHFIEQVRALNRYMTYCSLEISDPIPISDEEMKKMIDFMDEFGQFVKHYTKWSLN